LDGIEKEILLNLFIDLFDFGDVEYFLDIAFSKEHGLEVFCFLDF
jgi:hypothetical protein